MQWEGNEIFHEAPSLHTNAVTVFGFWQAGKCYIVFNEFSLDWTYTRNFFHGFRMREQSDGI